MTTIAYRIGSGDGLSLGTVAIIVASTLISGAAIGVFGFSLPVILLIGGVVALWLLALRADILLALAIIFAFVLAGVVRYFAATNVIANVAPMLLILLIIKAIFESRSIQVASVEANHRTSSLPVLYTFALFLAIVILSAFSHSVTSLALLFALKTYLPIAGLLVIAVVSRSFQQSVSRLWNLLLAIAVVQLPFIVYQHFFVAGTRNASVRGPSWDSIVGTMGGNPDGGGSSGALAIFLSLCLIYVINLVRLRLLRFSLGAIFGLVIFAGIALAEVKIVFVLLPIGIAAVFWSELKREPAKAFLILALGGIGTLGVLLIYQFVFWEHSRLLGSDIKYNLLRSLDYMLDPNYFRATTGEIGRFAGLMLWWSDAWNNPLTAVLGNGPGASRLNNLYIGDIARHYFPFTVDSTALVALLWDFGIVGAMAYFGVLVTGLRIGVRRLKNLTSAKDVASVHTAAVGIFFLALSCIYNKDILYLPQMSLLMAFCLATALSCGAAVSNPAAK
ncbi:MAG: hypothetical protein AB1443_10190 [Pseudomonadota bacterium]